MTESTAAVLLGGAASIGFLHTVIGVDHYLPFVVIGRARRWSFRRVMALTAVCGVGHVLGSMALGFVGIGLGVAVDRLELVEGVRGSLAAWGLIVFGLLYAAWSGVRAARGYRHRHVHAHGDGTTHDHDHDHEDEHLHVHDPGRERPGGEPGKPRLTSWALFVLFIFGPCEALIPMFMAPASEHDWWTVAAVAAVFSAATIGTMLVMVAIGLAGLRMLPLRGLEAHANTLAGLAIAGSGLAIQLLGI